MTYLKKVFSVLAWLLLAGALLLAALSFGKDPERIAYGVSFSKYYADELGIPWKEAYLSTLDELKVNKLRLAAYWPMVEPQKDEPNFEDLDFQMNEARARDANIILAVGQRLPRWPECHTPPWAKGLPREDQQKEILAYISLVVERYRSYENITYWQVENEPFLSVFAKEQCGDLDQDFLREEIALVKALDPERPVLVTDSGNLGLWHGAWRLGDVFGTSMYLYLWNPELGEVKSLYKPSFYKAKKNLMTLFFGAKKSILIELSLEPWLLEPTAAAPLELQLARMGMDKFTEVLDFAKYSGFDEQYLWGVEWWYFMRAQGHPEYWEKAKELF